MSRSGSFIQQFRRTVIVAVCVVLGLLAAAASAQAAKRVALVIGNSNYTSIAALDNPRNDAELIADTLAELDFNVIRLFDADQRSMKSAVQRFGQELQVAGKDAVGLFFYAGHGVEVLGENYLIPLNTAIEVESDLELDGVSTNWILTKMRAAGNALNIVVLDACRNNPFRTFRSASQGLGVLDAPRGSVIAYAAAPKQRAYDGTGKHSPYSAALAKWMQEPNLSVEGVFKNVLIDVEKTTNNRQTPWVSSSFKGNFFFAPQEVAAKAEPPEPPAPAAAPQSISQVRSDREALFWSSIQDSSDWRAYQAYLDRYGETGEFSLLAKLRRDRFKGEAVSGTPSLEEPALPATSGHESLFWSSIQDSNDWRAYQAYLDRYGEDAEFAALAHLRVERLKQKQEASEKTTKTAQASQISQPTQTAALPEEDPPVGSGNGAERSIVIVPSEGVMYAKRGSNLRSGPGTSYEIVGHLIAGEEVRVTGQVSGSGRQSGWYRLTSLDGEQGFVWKPLLGREKPQAPGSAPAKANSVDQGNVAGKTVPEPALQPVKPKDLTKENDVPAAPAVSAKAASKEKVPTTQVVVVPEPKEADEAVTYEGKWRLRILSENFFPGERDVEINIRDGSFYAPMSTTRWRGYLSGKVSASGRLTGSGTFNRTGGWYGGGEPMVFEWRADLESSGATTRNVRAVSDEGSDYLTIILERK